MADKRDRRRKEDSVLKGRRPAHERIPEAKLTQESAPAKEKKRKRKRPPREPMSVPWWAFALVILVVGGLTCGLWAYVLSLRADPTTVVGPTPTPVFIVITNTPTLGAPPEENAEAQPTATPPPAEDLPPTSTTAPASADIQVGRNVVIVGTGDAGLSIRQGPGLDFPIFFIGSDTEIFFVEDGPREAGGFTWWYIVDPNDPDRAGWAVSQFMQLQQP